MKRLTFEGGHLDVFRVSEFLDEYECPAWRFVLKDKTLVVSTFGFVLSRHRESDSDPQAPPVEIRTPKERRCEVWVPKLPKGEQGRGPRGRATPLDIYWKRRREAHTPLRVFWSMDEAEWEYAAVFQNEDVAPVMLQKAEHSIEESLYVEGQLTARTTSVEAPPELIDDDMFVRVGKHKVKLTQQERELVQYCRDQHEERGETEVCVQAVFKHKSTKQLAPSQLFRKDYDRQRKYGFRVFPLLFEVVPDEEFTYRAKFL